MGRQGTVSRRRRLGEGEAVRGEAMRRVEGTRGKQGPECRLHRRRWRVKRRRTMSTQRRRVRLLPQRVSSHGQGVGQHHAGPAGQSGAGLEVRAQVRAGEAGRQERHPGQTRAVGRRGRRRRCSHRRAATEHHRRHGERHRVGRRVQPRLVEVRQHRVVHRRLDDRHVRWVRLRRVSPRGASLAARVRLAVIVVVVSLHGR